MQKTNIQVTKSVLAKLLAGENITVVHERIKTAFFDLKNRSLHLPIYESMSGELYDLLVGHEDGHALYTPPQGWHDATVDALTEEQKKRGKKFNAGFKDVLNVCEDARIEKLIKRKYPGIARSFVIGYKDLWERDFFGVKRLKSLDLLNIVDRVNIHCKAGTHVIVPFNDEERELLREVEHAESWEDVVTVSLKLYERAKQERDDHINTLEDLTKQLLEEFSDSMSEEEMEDMFSGEGSEEGEESEEEEQTDQFQPFNPDGNEEETSTSGSGTDEGEESEEDADTSGDSGEESEDEDESSSGSSDENSDEEDTAESDDSDAEGGKEGGTDSSTEEEEGDKEDEGSEEGDDEEVQSVTDRTFREREQELVVDNIEVHNYTLPRPILENIIVPNRLVVDKFFEEVDRVKATRSNPIDIGAICVKRFNDNNMRYINLLAKEFEMRKNASQYARTTIARTGELDMSKLHQYRFSSNLFKKMNIVPKGKNHGMIMFVDMSGSMDSCFGATMEQTLILAAFCRKVNIPFDVYGFSDKRDFVYSMVQKGKLPKGFTQQKFMRMAGDTYNISNEDAFSLRHLIGSRMVGNVWKRAYEMMAIIAINWDNRVFTNFPMMFEYAGFSLSGTPFTHTVMASRPIIEKFKAETQADIVNVIYLTDGEGTGCFSFSGISNDYQWDPVKRKTHKIYMTDPRSKERIEMDMNNSKDQQTKMVEFVRMVTGCKHIGFYISGSGWSYTMRSLRCTEQEYNTWRKNLRDDGYFVTPQLGYDQYYYIKSPSAIRDEDDYEFEENMSKRKMISTFTNAQENKRKNRVIVSRFVQDIAKV